MPRDIEWDRPGGHEELVPTGHRVPWKAAVSALVHISGRQPARRLEILDIWHRNTAQGGRHNLFVEDGTVMFVTRYHEGHEVRGDVKIIRRLKRWKSITWSMYIIYQVSA